MEPMGLVGRSTAPGLVFQSPVRERRMFSGQALCPPSRFARPSRVNPLPESSTLRGVEHSGHSSNRQCPQAWPRLPGGIFPQHPTAFDPQRVEGVLQSGGAAAQAFFSTTQQRVRRVGIFLLAAKAKLWRRVLVPGWMVLQEICTTLLGAIDLLRYALLSQAGVELAVAIRWCRKCWILFLMLRRRRRIASVASEPSPALSLLRCLLDDSHSHEAKLEKLQATSALQSRSCQSVASDLMLSAGVSTAAVTCLMDEAARKGLPPDQVERIARRFVESTEDAEAALQKAFAAIFMAEPSASLRTLEES